MESGPESGKNTASPGISYQRSYCTQPLHHTKMAPEGAILHDPCDNDRPSHRLFTQIPETGFFQGSDTFFADIGFIGLDATNDTSFPWLHIKTVFVRIRFTSTN